MKQFFSLPFFLIFFTNVLFGHGFSANTHVVLANNSLQTISTICKRSRSKAVSVASVNVNTHIQLNQKIKQVGRSKVPCFVAFSFSKEGYDTIICTPTQEFYCAKTKRWVPAYKLRLGTELLCKDGIIKTIEDISLVQKPLDIYTIQIENTHTFFVSNYAVLTHNMVLPIAFSLSASVPFGAVAAGTVGTFFGPITVAVSAAVGAVAYALVKVFNDDKIPSYTVTLDNADHYNQYIEHNNAFIQAVPQASTVQNIPGCFDQQEKEQAILATSSKEQSASVATALSCTANCKPKQSLHNAFNPNKQKNRVERKPFDNNQKEQEPKKNPKEIYKGASYHHKNSKRDKNMDLLRDKSTDPINGQAALDNSVQVKDTSPTKVGISNE